VTKTDPGEPTQTVQFDDRYHTISRVNDGDTVVTDNGETVRLIGINAPEAGECYAEEATQALVGLVADREVYFTKDEEATDRNGRLLRYMFVHRDDARAGDLNINKEMVRLGYADAQVLAPNIQYRNALERASQDARKYNRGAWEGCDFEEWKDETEDTPPPNEECTVKGNISADGVKRYSTENCRSYGQIKINTRDGEEWFCSIEEAEAAGYLKNGDCFE
jgi:micrococcal nuclease